MSAAELLRHLGTEPGPILPLAEAALAFAALTRPGLDLHGYRRHFGDLAKAVQAVGGSSPAMHATALGMVLSHQFDYRGDIETYDDLANVDLARVIDRRRGLPVALGIIYIETARAQGWEAAGIGFPGHFLVALGSGENRILLDPFDRGLACTAARLRFLLNAAGEETELRPEHCREIDDRDVLLRLQNNIKIRLLHARQPEPALAIIDSMLMIAPGNAGLWNESARINAGLGRITAALASAEQGVAHAATAVQRERNAALLSQLKARLN